MDLLKWPLWERYAKKARERIERPRYTGCFTHTQAKERGMRLATGSARAAHEEIRVSLYWLVDESDGIIADAKFECVGPSGLIAAADAVCELALRKNYDQASRFSADLIERHLGSAFEEWAPHINRALDAVEAAVQQCSDIPFVSVYEATPLEEDFGEIPGGLPGWEEFSQEKKLAILDEVIDREIRPYIEMDAGGVTVLGLRENGEVRISYEGACTTCHSSTGSTLSAIQKILRARVHPSLFVVPEL